jgi:branched-chain amino acid aminotransferase
MSFDQTKWVWQNGNIIPWAEASTHVPAHALHRDTVVLIHMPDL